MYDVLIVEDEIMVRLGIKNSIPWEQYHMRVVADAEDGEDGLQKYLTYQPNVVITDIKMNRMNGDALIRKIRETDSLCVILVISCVEDFEILKSMVNLQILGYLSKASMLMEDIQRLLQSARDTLDALKIDSAREEDRNAVLERAALRYLQERGPDGYSQLEEECRERFPSGEITFLLYQASPLSGAEDSKFTLDSFRDVIFKEFGSDPVISLGRMLLLQFAPGNVEPGDERLSNVVDFSQRYLNRNVSVFVRRRQRTLSFPNDIRILHAYYQFFTDDGEQSVYSGDTRDIERDIKTNVVKGLTDNFIYAALSGQKKTEYLEKCDAICRHAFVSFEEFQKQLILFTQWLLKIKNCDEDSGILDFSRQIFYAHSLTEALSILRVFIQKSFKGITTVHPASRAMQKALDYIGEHIQEDLSLNGVAARCNLSGNYFSAMFKREIGKSFVQYVTELRIDLAKELLINTDTYLYEIALQVGYNDITYFSKTFKRLTGFAPSSWRSVYRA